MLLNKYNGNLFSQAINLLFIFIFIFILTSTSFAEQYVGEGKAKIFLENRKQSEKQALANAKRSLIEKEMHSIISIQYYQKNRKNIQERILKQPDKFLNNIVVISQDNQGTDIHVVIKAGINVVKLKEEFQLIELLKKEKSDNVLIVLKGLDEFPSFITKQIITVLADRFKRFQIDIANHLDWFNKVEHLSSQSLLSVVSTEESKYDLLLILDIDKNTLQEQKFSLDTLMVNTVAECYNLDSKQLIYQKKHRISILAEAKPGSDIWNQALRAITISNIKFILDALQTHVDIYYTLISNKGEEPIGSTTPYSYVLVFSYLLEKNDSFFKNILRNIDGFIAIKNKYSVGNEVTFEYKTELEKNILVKKIINSLKYQNINAFVENSDDKKIYFKKIGLL